MNNNNKLIIRMKGMPKDIAAGNIIALENGDPVKIEESPVTDLKPWDQAHLAYQQDSDISFAEPDVSSSEDYYPLTRDIETVSQVSKGLMAKDDYNHFINYWPHPDQPSIWHLDEGFSQLGPARKSLEGIPDKNVIRIAHFDTGYDPAHLSFPKGLIRTDLQRNFVDGEDEKNAADIFDSGLLKMPGHGTGTLSILAGAKMTIPGFGFDDYLGLHDSVEIVPVRIAKSVVLLKSGSFVKAMDYVVNELYNDPAKRVHVITMSMGGLAARAWADMVNDAYEKGIFIVTAAGNNYRKLPARTLIYPARFHRVVAACGVTYDYSPYHKSKDEDSFDIMEGNYGPNGLMDTAIAAFTPNVPWATYRFDEVVGIRGDGTSSATPQVAAAAALYYMKYFKELDALPESWMKVEAVRHAMFSSAKKQITGYDNDYFTYYGNGVLQASSMLAVPVASPGELVKRKEDTVSFPFFRIILGTKAITDESAEKNEMLDTELMQLVLSTPELQKLMNNEELDIQSMTNEELNAFIDTVINSKDASDTLKRNMLELKRVL